MRDGCACDGGGGGGGGGGKAEVGDVVLVCLDGSRVEMMREELVHREDTVVSYHRERHLLAGE